MERITYKKSLAAKLVLHQESIAAYQALKDLCSTYKKVSTRRSFGKETISYGRVKVAAIKIVVRHINLHLALDPKEFENTKYHFKDMSQTKQGQIYPMRVSIKGSRSLKYALELLEVALFKAGATELCLFAETPDYQKEFHPRSVDKLIQEGLIKKYVKIIEDGTDVIEEENLEEEILEAEELEEEEDFEEEALVEEPKEDLVEVTFNAKTLYAAEGQAKKLYIITNTTGWNVEKAIPMKKNKDNSFTAVATFPRGTHLEFKICKDTTWNDVEKGIWKEEIRNHYYHLDKDMLVEDLIHNFRED
ncbi:MAG: hypothetical protein K2K48_04790 [Anaeroplasmataceae bacterium]|nr:hypothetical protein [Anaeroplasmataceae bacterium]MDE6414711.1 hypothetical protein [Anaeroplasmataceae bacterium]